MLKIPFQGSFNKITTITLLEQQPIKVRQCYEKRLLNHLFLVNALSTVIVEVIYITSM